MGHDLAAGVCSATCSEFQSTRPARGATTTSPQDQGNQGVSIHAPRTGRDKIERAHSDSHNQFQSTRPARGATSQDNQRAHIGIQFQSTRPARGATKGARLTYQQIMVSIHAPRTGRDQNTFMGDLQRIGFNPRAPHGARQDADGNLAFLTVFQSTRPARGATRILGDRIFNPAVSIHAPRTGRDSSRDRVKVTVRCFNPRAHAGRDATCRLRRSGRPLFQSTRPRGARQEYSPR